MLSWAVIFLVIAILAGAFGLGRVEDTAASIAKFLFLVFIILFLLSLLAPVTFR